jgi:dihydroxyacetone kinase-like protein
MKKIINNPHNVVKDMLQGLVAAHPELRILPETQVVVRKDVPVPNKVGLISGGGSGHEPAHAGFVGPGMLDAACAGDVFTSPSVDQMLAGIKAVNSGKGVLIVAKNYTGDNLNFDLAIDMAVAQGIGVEKVVVADDVAVGEGGRTTGRRGVAGTVFVHKIAGAKAAEGASLDEVKAAALQAIANVRSFGMALAPCTIPSVGKPSFQLADNEIEIGIGIHGEKGVKRAQLIPADRLAIELSEPILQDLPYQEGAEVAVMVNGMGATPLMELYILFNELAKILAQKKINIYKAFVGEYMTSLEMSGCSVTLLKLTPVLKRLLDYPANTPGFKQH